MEAKTAKPFYVVLDFEANCSASGARDHEIIEFPAVLVDAATGALVAEFRQFVQTVNGRELSPFTEELTGITTAQVRARGVPWARCLKLFDKWCWDHGLSAETATVVTCGDWDLKTMLPRQLALTQTKLSNRLKRLFACWHNVKAEYRDVCQTRRLQGMANMLAELGLGLVGRHHSGIDDCRNIARICAELRRRSTGSDATRPNRYAAAARSLV